MGRGLSSRLRLALGRLELELPGAVDLLAAFIFLLFLFGSGVPEDLRHLYGGASFDWILCRERPAVIL